MRGKVKKAIGRHVNRHSLVAVHFPNLTKQAYKSSFISRLS